MAHQALQGARTAFDSAGARHKRHVLLAHFVRDYDGGAHTIVLGHLSEQNNLPELARLAAEQAIGNRMTLLGNRILLAQQAEVLAPICL